VFAPAHDRVQQKHGVTILRGCPGLVAVISYGAGEERPANFGLAAGGGAPRPLRFCANRHRTSAAAACFHTPAIAWAMCDVLFAVWGGLSAVAMGAIGDVVQCARASERKILPPNPLDLMVTRV
jgi:hypothetical protein